MNFKLISLVVIFVLSVIFMFQNVAIVKIQFLFWSLEISQALLMFFVIAIGISFGWFLRGYYRFRKVKSR